MKRLLCVFLICSVLAAMTACGNSDSGDVVTAIPIEQEEQSEEVRSSSITDEKPDRTETVAAPDPYVGEYNDYDVNEPNLEIQRNEDGTYTIQIGIFRLAYLDDGVGKKAEDGIEFTVTAPNGSLAEGIITLEDDIATVTFISGWSEFSDISEFQYYKTSDISNIKVP